MANTITQLSAPAALTNTLTTTLYTVPASTKTIVKEIILCNTDTVARTVTIYFGGGSAAGNTILSAYSLAAGQTIFLTLSTVLVATNTIKGGASAASVVSCTISGIEVA